MLVEFIAAGVLLSLGLILFGLMGEEKKTHLIIAGSLLLVITSIFVVVDSTGVEVQTYGGCMNASVEQSHVWNCTEDVEYCFGEPEPWSCVWYNETQCGDISDCSWSAQSGCSGTPDWTCTELYNYGGAEKCGETKGCWVSTEVNPQTCDNYTTIYTYGPCFKETLDYNFSQAFALFGMLAGIGLALGAIAYARNKPIEET